MKLNVQYVFGRDKQIKSVLLPFDEWKYLKSKFESYAQELNLKKDLIEVFKELKKIETQVAESQTLDKFLDEL